MALSIHKTIAVAGGLAGGSTDAAGALVACDALWGTNASRDELMALAAELGSDVPFCLTGGIAIGTGRGENVSPVLARGGYEWVLAYADEQSADARRLRRARQAPRRRRLSPSRPCPEDLMTALRTGDPYAVGPGAAQRPGIGCASGCGRRCVGP